MAKMKAGSRGSIARLKAHAEAQARLAALRGEKDANRARLVQTLEQAQARADKLKAAKAAALKRARTKAPAVQMTDYARRKLRDSLRAYDAREAAKKAEEKAADKLARATTRKPGTAPATVTVPTTVIDVVDKVSTKHFNAILHDRNGWWEVVVFMRRSTFVVPFYQTEPPTAVEAHRAVTDEINRRMRAEVKLPSPRKPSRKAPALPGAKTRETGKVRRIERTMEGV